MKRLLLTVLLTLTGLMLSPGLLPAADQNQMPAEIEPIEKPSEVLPEQPEAKSPLAQTLEKYKNEGYEVRIGPVQYLGKTSRKIKFYRHKPISYSILHMVDEQGGYHLLKTYDFVYVLSKDARVVLIRLEREEEENA